MPWTTPRWVHSPFEGVDRRLCSSSASCPLMADFAGGSLCTEAVQSIRCGFFCRDFFASMP